MYSVYYKTIVVCIEYIIKCIMVCIVYIIKCIVVCIVYIIKKRKHLAVIRSTVLCF